MLIVLRHTWLKIVGFETSMVLNGQQYKSYMVKQACVCTVLFWTYHFIDSITENENRDVSICNDDIIIIPYMAIYNIVHTQKNQKSNFLKESTLR